MKGFYSIIVKTKKTKHKVGKYLAAFSFSDDFIDLTPKEKDFLKEKMVNSHISSGAVLTKIHGLESLIVKLDFFQF